MKLPKRTLPILAILLLSPLGAQADSWSCRHGNDVREVHVVTPGESPVPCEVVYKKLTEGAEDQVLWNAQNDGSYCSSKATEFVAKLESWGWTCVETIAEPTATN